MEELIKLLENAPEAAIIIFGLHYLWTHYVRPIWLLFIDELKSIAASLKVISKTLVIIAKSYEKK